MGALAGYQRAARACSVANEERQQAFLAQFLQSDVLSRKVWSREVQLQQVTWRRGLGRRDCHGRREPGSFEPDVLVS